MNWKLTLTKAVVMAVLTFLVTVEAGMAESTVTWVTIAAALVEPIRDLIKRAFGAFVPAE